MGHLKKEEFVCVDCETTGLDPKNDRIVEVAVATFTLEQVLYKFESLVDPLTPIPEETTKIHNITQEMVIGKPTIEKVLPEVFRIIGNKTIVGHGILFDIEVLATAAEKSGVPCTIRNNRFIDTLRMARHYGESPTNSLEQLRNHFSIAEEGAHRAMNDVTVNIEVFKNLCRDYTTLEQVMEMLSKPIALKTMPLGPHKGRPLRDVPMEYLIWMANKNFDEDLIFTIRSEIKRRKKGDSFKQAANPFADL